MSFTEGPILIMCLSKENAVESWKKLMGPENLNEAKTRSMTTLRGRYGQSIINEMDTEVVPTLVYGSDTQKEAYSEIRFFFPNFLTTHIHNEFSISRYLQENIYDLLFDGLYKCAQIQPDEPIVWIGKWLLANNHNKPIFEIPNKVPIITENSFFKTLNAIQMPKSNDNTTSSSTYYSSWLDSSTDLSQSNSLDNSSDSIEKCLLCPNCQKMIQLIYSPKILRSSLILGDIDASNEHTDKIINQLLVKPLHHISKPNFSNSNSRRDSVKCRSCEIFKINLRCFDELANNLDFKLGCEK